MDIYKAIDYFAPVSAGVSVRLCSDYVLRLESRWVNHIVNKLLKAIFDFVNLFFLSVNIEETHFMVLTSASRTKNEDYETHNVREHPTAFIIKDLSN